MFAGDHRSRRGTVDARERDVEWKAQPLHNPRRLRVDTQERVDVEDDPQRVLAERDAFGLGSDRHRSEHAARIRVELEERRAQERPAPDGSLADDAAAPIIRLRSTEGDVPLPGGGPNEGAAAGASSVSGVAALLFARYPQATAAQVKQALVSSRTPVPQLVGAVGCGGVVNAPAALEALRVLLAS